MRVSLCLLYYAVVVWNVTQLHDVVYIVCGRPSTILRFNATTHQRLTDINIKDLRSPWDIVACEQTSRLYVADDESVWRLSEDGADIKRLQLRSPLDKLKPRSLSLTSSRLLVTSHRHNQLTQYDAAGDERRRVQLSNMQPFHAEESPTGTFIVSHQNFTYSRRPDVYQVSEVNMDGKVLRQFSGSRFSLFAWPPHFAIDGCHGYVFVAHRDSCCILLLDAALKLRRVIVDEQHLNYKSPGSLCYREQTGQLLVGLHSSVAMFDVLCR